MQFQWLILQDGKLPLQLDGRMTSDEHVCTTTLIWPVEVRPSPSNSLIIDPCFTARGIRQAASRLSELGISWDDIGYFFETHRHSDHVLHVPSGPSIREKLGLSKKWSPSWHHFTGGVQELSGPRIIDCPGHDVNMRAIHFHDPAGEIWVASDAVLNRQWLVAWGYYWPNVYDEPEVVQTWRSVAMILANADVVVPGHGPPIHVNASLLEDLIHTFPPAEYARQCPDVLDALRARLREIRCREDAAGHR